MVVLDFSVKADKVWQDPEVAQHLLKWAQRGLKILLVHNTRELKWLQKKRYINHEKAASTTQGLDGRDAELSQTIEKLLTLPNVTSISEQAQTVDALRRLGVSGRAEFSEPNMNILTHLREDHDVSYLFLYHFLYETGKATEVKVCFDGQAAVSRINPWTPEITPFHDCTTEHGRTVCNVTLQPGEATILCLDRSKPPATLAKQSERTTILELETWDVTVEDWNAGEIEIIKEDRGKGYETIEHRPHTKVTPIKVGNSRLQSWKDMPSVGPHVSGVGEYRATFSLPDDFDASQRYKLHLGSTYGGLGNVQINGGPKRGFDTSSLEVDLTGSLHPGTNEMVVRVSSALNNRLIQRGYYEPLRDGLKELYGAWKEGDPAAWYVRDHGLLGPVRIYSERWSE